jgi:hypothetical protein
MGPLQKEICLTYEAAGSLAGHGCAAIGDQSNPPRFDEIEGVAIIPLVKQGLTVATVL